VVLKNPDEELEQFLAKQPPWMRKALQGELPSTATEAAAFAEYGPDRFLDLRREYEALASRVPEEWREYRKQRERSALVDADLPPAKRGRPRKDPLAQEARQLQVEGKSYAQIAMQSRWRFCLMDLGTPLTFQSHQQRVDRLTAHQP
jgi:hypothetical protein